MLYISRKLILGEKHQIVLLMTHMTTRAINTYSSLILFVGSSFFFLASSPTSIFTINSSGTDSKEDIIKVCQKITCAAVLKELRSLQHH